MYVMKQSGWIEVICGSMFSGKTEELIRRIRRAQYGKLSVQVFKPAIDNRYEEKSVVSHNGTAIVAHPVHTTKEILKKVKQDTQVIAIDEGQFFDQSIVSIANTFANKGIRVIIAGLDTDFRGEPFGPMPHLMALAESVTKLTAICPVCSSPATRTQRLINGKPASYNDPIVMVGAAESYESRCRHHHEVPDKPENKVFNDDYYRYG